MVDFINDYTNDEDEGTFEIPPSNNRRGGIDRAEKEGGFNEALGFVFETSIQSLRKKRSLAWAFYDSYEEDGKKTDLKWYFCNLLYAKKLDNMKEGMTGMILCNKINTSSFRNHVVIAQKINFHTLFLTWMVNQRLWLVMMSPPLREVWTPLYHIGKCLMMSTLVLVQW